MLAEKKRVFLFRRTDILKKRNTRFFSASIYLNSAAGDAGGRTNVFNFYPLNPLFIFSLLLPRCSFCKSDECSGHFLARVCDQTGVVISLCVKAQFRHDEVATKTER